MPQPYKKKCTLKMDKYSVVCHKRLKYHGNINKIFWLYITFLGCLMHSIYEATGFANDGINTNPTPALRLDKQGLTTVLLLRNDNEQNHGRFINVRPEVGLLTSTARTFIQEGITTEYATQVVGTTLDNGRMYAHLLKKTSRILYDPLKLVTDTILSEPYRKTTDDYESLSKNLPLSHNDLFNAEKPDWRAIDDSIFLQRNNFISNTDLVNGLSEKNSENADLKRYYPTFEIKAHSSKILMEGDKKMDDNVKHRVIPQKVLPEANLPTFTIKHHYEPSGYGYKNYTHLLINDGSNGYANEKHGSNLDRQPKNFFQSGETFQEITPQAKNKIIYSKGKSHLSTVTYYGFSDFTTTVGDSVIVFSPSIFDSATAILNANVTSITGEATINDKTAFTTKSYTPTETTTMSTEVTAEEAKFEDDVILKESAIYIGQNIQSETTKILDPSENTLFETSSNILESSATDPLNRSKEMSTTHLDTIVNVDRNSSTYNMMVAPYANITNIGGATTIFFENDPFTDFLSISSSSTSSSSLSSNSSTLYTTTENNLMEYIDEGELNDDDEEEGEILENEYTTTVFTTSTEQREISDVSSTVIVKEIGLNDTEIDTTCSKTSQIFLTNSPKTITTTITSTHYLISDQITKTLTDFHLNYLQSFDIGETTKYYCIQTVPVINEQLNETVEKQLENFPANNPLNNTSIVESVAIEENTIIQTLEKPNTYSIRSIDSSEFTSTYLSDDTETTTKNRDEVILNTEYFNEPVEEIEGTEKNEIDEDGEEIELFYKTFYTTYTYLTTYFQEQNTSISSHIEVVTQVITSTVTNNMVTKNFNDNIIPTTSLTSHSSTTHLPTDNTKRYTLPNDIKSYLIKRKEAEELEPIIEKDGTVNTPDLFNENNICINDKTYYTTYTYYTTIFGDDGTEISSRTEVHKNLIKPTRMFNVQNDQSLCSKLPVCNDENYNPNEVNRSSDSLCYYNKSQIEISNTPSIEYSTLKSSNNIGSKLNVQDKEIKRQIFDDQINSESNVDDEILTSAAVLLKTSFTTYTYYTTIYTGDTMNVISRLETITNTHTETLQPIAKTQTVEDSSLPITYFTTFTYWTKLAKDGHITTLSREETVSNIIIPSKVEMLQSSELQTVNLTDYHPLSTLQNLNNENVAEITYSTQPIRPIYEGSTKLDGQSELEIINSNNLLIPTTYYTTYTYYTTSYEANATITNSRLETVTNIVTPTTTIHLKNMDNTYTNIGKKKEAAFFELKKIIDGDGISTLYITTQVEPTWGINGEYTEITSTSSSLYVNETRKYLMSSSIDTFSVDEQKQKVYKTGLVRLIDGTRIGNNTTTLYKSKVIGTIIDQRYAQIIESTSSFLFKQNNKDSDDLISSTQVYDEKPMETTSSFSHNASLLQSTSTSQQLETVYNQSIDHLEKDENLDESNHDDSNVDQKQAFTPIIRPFAKHNQFLQRKTLLSPSSATIITRSDFTPTITATPALKSVSRFSSSRHGSNIISTTPAGFNGPSRRFGRGPLKHTSQVIPNSSRNRLHNNNSSQRGASSLGFKRLTGLSIRPTYLRPSVFSNGPSANAKFGRGRFSAPTSNIDDTNSDDESLDTKDLNQEDDLKDNVALPHDQHQINSLLRNRKLQPINKSNRISSSAKPFNYNIGRTRSNPLKAQSRATTPPTTVKTTTARPRSFQRPIISQRDRIRSSSNLFPPRNIFSIIKSPAALETTPEEKSNLDESVTDDNENDEGIDYDEEDDEDEILEEDDVDDLNRNRRSYSNATLLLINSQTTLSRVKRKADNISPSNTNFRNRLGRLKKPNQNLQKVEDLDANTTTPHSKTTRPINAARLNPKHHNTVISPSRSIKPTRFMAEGRSKFTLRDKDSNPATTQKNQQNRSNFRRPQPFTDASTSTRTSSNDNISNNNDKRRLKNYSGRNSDLSSSGQNSRNSIPTRSSNPTNGRSRLPSSSTRDFSSRNRGRGQNNNSQNSELILDNDGTITVTHVIPIGTTIPIINGKITEYKEVITAKSSTEILSPLQYTSVNSAGLVQLLLTRQDTSVNNAGVTEVTQYLLHETPTTIVTFTPTTIRGRRTSFSHILPSTVYSVERLTSTVQPKIISNAPLANILLSQLLLGNIGLSPGVNPFLAALGGATGLQPTVGIMSTMAATPVTEYRTHASTYVTTVYEGQSTVLPVTFQGKKILTTVYDTTAQTITATEFITDTIITTPSVMVPQAVSPVQPVVNSLLLQQLLLQQHLQNQPSPLEFPGNLLMGILDMTTSASQQLNLNGDNLQELDSTNNIRAQSHDLIQGEYSSDSGTLNIEDIALTDQTNTHKVGRKKSRKSNKSLKRKPQIEPTTLQSSSVITLYVSGRRPGEFSTILSTVPIRPDNTQYKRHAPELFTTNMWNPFNYDDNDEMNNDILNLDFSSVNAEPTPILNTFSKDIKQKPSSTQKNFPHTITNIPVTSGTLNVNTLLKSSELFSV